MENIRSASNKSTPRKGKISTFASILAGALLLASPNLADAQNTSSQTRSGAEISTSTILDRLNLEIGVSLPDEYNQKILDFVLNDTIMRTRSATAYTEEFIINEMKKDRGISKQNQLLFIRSSIYEGISQKKLYDILNDENYNRYDEYEKASELIDISYEEYKKGFKIYMENGIAEADRRYNEENRRYNEENRRYNEENRRYNEENRRYNEADSIYNDADRRYNEYKRETVEYLNISLNAMKDFYNSRKKDPSLITKQEIVNAKLDAKKTILLCKEYGVNYELILSPEMLKFYGIE